MTLEEECEVFLWPDRDREAFEERAAIRNESGEALEAAERAALNEVREDRTFRTVPPKRTNAEWKRISAERRRMDALVLANRRWAS